MPFIANTPESLVARSDSKNPSTTCRGITSSGRTCRRRISPSGLDQKAVGGSRHFGSRLRVDDPRDERLYCWQHKEQASMSARSSPGPQTSPSPILEERTSLDTLADRLNLLSMTDGYGGKRMTGDAGVRPSTSLKSPGGRTQRPRPRTSRTAFFCFCFEIPSDEASLPSPRPRPRPAQLSGISSSSGSAHVAHARGKGNQTAEQTYRDRTSPRSHHHQPGSRKPSTASQTAQYLALVPKTVSPQTASSLMAELAKPFSQVDEPGYIYMFWLTPESQQVAPPTEAARSLLLPLTRPDGGDWRRASDIVASFAAGEAMPTEKV
ncbi:hypothetical protein SPBR_03031 [Sporothrix brasiliensis 5110]|uniref:Uncharacterized protein n=1 Tax=Sporothrix brasiliensis 5110 TaxID=1398154 RepID=A0A0C2IZ65_9PEZI|nr:uncharacterized protein SPBR_03031 [Sporothrix brasiliensis 5110]KIH92005.1 hypothetical protein SPBR_03031 [Sporothrix brasiliensis 5110]